MFGSQRQNGQIQVEDELLQMDLGQGRQSSIRFDGDFVQRNGTDQAYGFRLFKNALNLRSECQLGDSRRYVQRRGVEQKSQLVAPLQKGCHFLIRHRPRCFVQLFRRHLNNVFQRSELWNPLGRCLNDLGDDLTVAFNRDAFSLLHRRQELSQLVLRFRDGDGYACILARL